MVTRSRRGGHNRQATTDAPSQVLLRPDWRADGYQPDPQAPHLAYAFDIVEGRIPAGRLCRLACQRSIEEHRSPPAGFVYDWAFAYSFIRFAQSLFHCEGDFAAPIGRDPVSKAPLFRPFELEPWQIWYLGELFGWRMADDLGTRRFWETILEIAKKNGKTSMTAVIALESLCQGEEGQEIYAAATKFSQAAIVWKMACRLAERAASAGRAGLIGQMKILSGKSEMQTPRGTFGVVSKQAKSLDGKNPSLLLVDEAAAIEDRDVVERLATGMAGRAGALTCYLTTPQAATNTVYFETREEFRLMLEGKLGEEFGAHRFGCVWGLDDDDDFDDPGVWIKANPNLGVSVRRERLADDLRKARVSTDKLHAFKIFHMAQWVGNLTGWFPSHLWDACAGSVQRLGRCFVGVDLAQVRDLCAVARIWDGGPRRAYVDFHCWATSAYVNGLPRHLQALYASAVERGDLTVTETPTADLDAVEAYVRATCEDHEVEGIGVDPYNAQHMTNRLHLDGLPVVIVSQAMAKLNDPTMRLEKMARERWLVHEGSPFIAWQFGNAQVYRRDKSIKVKRAETDESAKIDAIAALITAMAVYDQDGDPEAAWNVQFYSWDAESAAA